MSQTQLLAALLAFQTDAPPLVKNQVGTVAGTSKAGRGYEYSYPYLDLPALLAATRPGLTAVGLVLWQCPVVKDGSQHLITTLAHVPSGETLKAEMFVGRCGMAPQEMGSAMSYIRRYSFLAILGLAPVGEDDDGAVASPPRTKPKTKAAPAKAQITGTAGKLGGVDQLDALDDAIDRTRKPLSLSQKVAVACGREAFWRWIEEYHGIAITSEAEATQWVYDRYQIASRIALDQPGDAATVAAEDLATFSAWMRLG